VLVFFTDVVKLATAVVLSLGQSGCSGRVLCGQLRTHAKLGVLYFIPAGAYGTVYACASFYPSLARAHCRPPHTPHAPHAPLPHFTHAAVCASPCNRILSSPSSPPPPTLTSPRRSSACRSPHAVSSSFPRPPPTHTASHTPPLTPCVPLPLPLPAIYNILTYENLRALDPTTYFLLLQGRVVVTAVIYSVCFGKRLSKLQVCRRGMGEGRSGESDMERGKRREKTRGGEARERDVQYMCARGQGERDETGKDMTETKRRYEPGVDAKRRDTPNGSMNR